MTSLDTTSSQIGDYLLRGWTLLDEACPICYTPLLRARAPDAQLLCVKCGRDPSSSPVLVNGTTAQHAEPANDLTPVGYPVVNGDAMDSDEEEQEAGILILDSTTRPVPSAEQHRTRREQSDRASKLIGEKLLQGYCLLEEICPTDTCYGVPLLRLPRDTERRMCVICEKVFPEYPPRETVTVIQPNLPTLPPIQALETTSSGMASTVDGAGDVKVLVNRAYESLARQLVRLTEILVQHDTGSKEYDEYLGRISRVVETMYTMRK